MKDYWLAKLISSVTEVDSRKRLQKSIYLLQHAGCPLQFSYILHYYGPYSFELAALIDQLHGAGIIEERPESTGYGNVRYKSQIIEKGRQVLEKFEKSKISKDLQKQIRQFIEPFKALNQENLWVLELAATVAYFHEDDWTKAKTQTAKFKRISVDTAKLKEAELLAKKFKGSA